MIYEYMLENVKPYIIELYSIEYTKIVWSMLYIQSVTETTRCLLSCVS